MALVVDASVALKWVLDEDGRAAALALIGGARALAAPDFLLLECANVLAGKVKAGKTTPEAAAFSLQAIETTHVRLVPALPHAARAHAIAVELGQTAYDSLYLAVALAEDAVLVTADGRFARAALAHPAYAPSIRLL